MTRSGLRVVQGDLDRPIRKLRAYADAAEDLTPVWPKVQVYISKNVAEQFDTRGLHFKTGWNPLDPDYGTWKIKHGHGTQPLVLTGGLRDSFLGLGRYAIKNWDRNSGKFGSRHPLAHLHQEGSRGGKVPARPILVIRTEMRDGITRIIGDHITGKV